MSLLDLHAGVIALALLIAAPALAQTNLVTNGSFDEDVLGWEPVEDFISIRFDPEDVDASEDSGSARVTFGEDLLAKKGHVAQCVAVLPGRTYVGAASFLIPSEQNRMGSAGLRVAWFESSNCSGFFQDGFGFSGNREGQWTDLPSLDFVAPDGIFSAEVQLEIQKPQLGGTLVAHYDEVMFLPEPSSSLSALTALAGIIALASWRRPRETG
jgi:hypothetical protein